MIRTAIVPVLASVAFATCSPAPKMAEKPTTTTTAPAPATKKFTYPATRTSDTVYDHHGTKVADPYSWLEDPDSEETAAWVKAQNQVTFGYLESIPQREPIRKRITELFDFEKFSTPWKEGGRYFWFRNDGLQPQYVLYTSTSPDPKSAKVLIDPNVMSKDGTVALGPLAVSMDGKMIAYAIADAGSDWHTFRVREIDTGKDLSDEVKWVKFSGASWTKDGKGFFYSRYPEPKQGDALEGQNYFHKLYYHRLGEPQSKDTLVYESPENKEWGFGGQVTEDGRYLAISVWKGTGPQNLLYWKDLQKADAPVVKLVDTWEAEYSLVSSDGSTFWFKTDKDAPRGKVVSVDITKPDSWKTVIAEAPETLQGVGMVADTFAASYLRDAKSVISLFGRDGRKQRDVELPGIGTAGGFGGRRTDTESFYMFTGFTSPGTIYRYDFKTQTSSVFAQPKLKFDPAQYETKQVFYPAKDGKTKIPMFITAKKGIVLDGKNPTYLYGYGGFNNAVTPSFSASIITWMEMGGVYAVANIRGGGEYGEDWHQQGILDRKQNVFDDFIGAAEWLIANKYTSTPKLAIGGGSNGGLLVGACITQRPDLFGAALPAVGVLDMLRFHKFTIGWAWVDDYGSADDPKMFPHLLKYSPLHNLKKGTKYPSTLITTADHDDRVVPAHSFKFAAAIQAAHAGENPVLIRIETRAGHGAGKPTAKAIEESADKWAFLVRELRMEPSVASSK